MSSPGHWLLLAGGLAAASLGLWQLVELEERRAANRPAASARALPVASLDDPAEAGLAERSGLHQRRVRVTGRYDHAAEIVIRDQRSDGVAGVRIVTPLLPLRGDTAILVERGFVPSPDGRAVGLAGLEEAGVREVKGIALQLADTGAGEPVEQDGVTSWRRVDLAAFRARVPYPVHRFVVRQTPDSALPRLPRREPPPPMDDGPHLGYAILWLGLAAAALLAWAARFKGRHRPGD